jgi:hypothetical protein
MIASNSSSQRAAPGEPVAFEDLMWLHSHVSVPDER